jgi:uncharacterized protein YkwD
MRRASSTSRIGAAPVAPIALAVSALVPVAVDQASRPTEQLEERFLAAINDVRRAHDLPAVRFDRRLGAAARRHSRDMISRGYFAHGRFAQRIVAAGAPGNWVGEVLGWTSSRRAQVRVLLDLWLQSPTHRAVILARNDSLAGVGVSRGSFEGHRRTLVVTIDFTGWAGR